MNSELKISKEVLDLKEDSIEIRRKIHSYPELGFEETKTSELIFNKLTELGYEVKRIAKTGVVGLLRGKDESKTIAYRADIDALPVKELNNIPYKSKIDGKMHACGHDGHVAIALATAKIIKENQNNLKGNVKFIFQPAEEGPGGAEPMIKEGVLQNPDVNGIIGLHLWNKLPVGKIGIKTNELMASADEFIIKIQGKGGHGAMPEQTIDSIVVAAHFITSLQTIISRNINPLDSAVVTVGKINGGENYNVIADSVELKGTVRTFKPEIRKEIEEKIEHIIKNVTSTFGAKYSFEYIRIYPSTINNSEMTNLIKESAIEVIGENNIENDVITMAAEDMSFFLNEIPGCYFFLGSSNSSKGLDFPHHSPYFDFDEDSILIGTQIMVNAIFNYFEKF